MIEIEGQKYYTLDEVVGKSGYQRGTLYNLTSQKILSHPVRGLGDGLYPSQGLYSEVVFKELEMYRRLKQSGMRKREIIAHLTITRVQDEQLLQVLEA